MYKVHYVVSFGATLFVFNAIAMAQMNRTSFGIVNEFATQKYPQEIFIGDFNGNKQMDFGVRSKSVIAFFRKNSLGYWVKKQFLLDTPSTSSAVADFNRDGFDDVAILEPSPLKIEIFWGGKRDSLYSTKAFSSGKNYDDLVAADMNNDGLSDLLLFGKSSSGIGVVMQSETGDFYYAATLFREISVGSIIPLDINGDRNIDLYVQDWIGNKIKLLQQRSYLKFSSVYQWQMNSAPNQFLVRDVNDDGLFDILINVPDEKKMHIYYADAFGKFIEQQAITFEISPSSFSVSDVNNDKLPDILVSVHHQKKIMLYWNEKENAFQEWYEFAAGENPMQVMTATLNGKYSDAVILDKQQNEIFIFTNGKNSPQFESVQQLAAGIYPTGIIFTDVFHDGNADFIIANEGSHSLSIFPHQKKERFDGQLQLKVNDSPLALQIISEGKTAEFLTTHKQTQKISVIKIQYPSLESSFEQIGTEKNPAIRGVQKNEKSSLLQIFVEHASAGSLVKNKDAQTVSLSLFQEVSNGQFIEDEIEPLQKEKMLGTLMTDVNQDGLSDIVFSSIDEHFHLVSLFSAKGKKVKENTPPAFYYPEKIFSLADSAAARVLLWSNDLNGDKLSDIVGNVQSGTNTLFFSYHTNATTFIPPLQRLHNVQISHTDLLQFYDYNSDGIVDILFYNSLTKSLQVSYGKRNGQFQLPRTIFSSKNLGGFVVGDFNSDGSADIAATETSLGVVSLYWGN